MIGAENLEFSENAIWVPQEHQVMSSAQPLTHIPQLSAQPLCALLGGRRILHPPHRLTRLTGGCGTVHSSVSIIIPVSAEAEQESKSAQWTAGLQPQSALAQREGGPGSAASGDLDQRQGGAWYGWVGCQSWSGATQPPLGALLHSAQCALNFLPPGHDVLLWMRKLGFRGARDHSALKVGQLTH